MFRGIRAEGGIVVVAAALGLLAPSVRGQDAEPASRPMAQSSPQESLQLVAGHSTLLRSPWAISRVNVTDPKIADVQAVNPQQVLIVGKAVGTTDVLVWGANDQFWSRTVQVGLDQAAIRAELARLFPRSELTLGEAGGALVVSGMLAKSEQVEQLHRLLDVTGMKYVDLTRVPGIPQVQLKVTVAEASRNAVRALGVNILSNGNSAFGGVTIGPENSGPINPLTVNAKGAPGSTDFSAAAAVSPATTLFGGIPSADLEIFVQALAENQYLRVLAEPTLVALSGQEASFLAGGEFPVPVPQNSSGSTTITVEYKEFGVRLKFRPQIEGDGEIRLHVAPEVSDISNGPGSVQISGFNIPALLTRRAETTLKLHSGQTFAMAGLINESVNARNSRIPGLGDVPVLGALFRSVRYQKGDTEMLVLVTATLVEPSNSVGPVPGAAHVEPDDWQLYAAGMIEGTIPSAGTGAPIGQLSELRGPGAWAAYDSPAPAATPSSPAGPATSAPSNAR